MKQNICAVFDIGKGENSVVIFNEHFECIEQKATPTKIILDADGFRSEDAAEVKRWILESFDELRKDKRYNLKAVNFTSYAGGMIHLDKNGNPVTPIYDVLKNLPYVIETKFKDEILATYDLCSATGSPFFGIMNAGVQLYWLKLSYPDLFEKIATSLFLPQYGCYVLTGKLVAERSSLDCHSMLWDNKTDDYHQWLSEHELRSKLPEVVAIDAVTPAKVDKDIIVGVGMQNLLSSLLLYDNILEPFVLSSSKAWTINSNPFAKSPLSARSLNAHSFSFNSINNQAVHASRVFAGNEHDRQVKYLAGYFDKPTDYYKQVKYDVGMVWKLRERFPQATPDTTDPRLLLDCAFVERNINQFKSYEEAYHQFILDLVAQEVASIKLVLGHSKIRKIIIEGDFVKNDIYVELMNEAFFDKIIYINENYCSGVSGAALIISSHWTSEAPESQSVNLKKIG